MTDKELLELAAKAAGVTIGVVKEPKGHPAWCDHCVVDGYDHMMWAPFIDDAQAFRLMVELGLEVRTDGPYLIAVTPRYVDNELYEPRGEDPYAAVRRGIVKAAAEIGRNHD